MEMAEEKQEIKTEIKEKKVEEEKVAEASEEEFKEDAEYPEEKKVEEKKEVKEVALGVKEEKEGEKKEEKKKEGKKEGKRPTQKPVVKKEEAIVNGYDLPISTKHAKALCKFIKGKRIENVLSELELVIRKKKAVPMKGEIPHRKGKGMMSGRYPEKASKVFIKLLKTLKANAANNGMEVEKTKIVEAKANQAERPYRRFGTRKFKRSHVFIKAKEIKLKEEKKV